MEENILVFPNRIRFGVDTHGRLIEECITISSAWSKTIAFRITPSVSDVLSLPSATGYLQPFQSLRIPVTSLHSVSATTFHISISVDISTCDEDSKEDYPTADLFWTQKRINYTTRIITCACVKEGDTGLEDSDMSESNNTNTSRPSTPSKVHPPRGHILNLMVKNVSKDDPLNSNEKEELKAIRGLMSREQWTNWLSFARLEKKLRLAGTSVPSGALDTPGAGAGVSSQKHITHTHTPHHLSTPTPRASAKSVTISGSARSSGSGAGEHMTSRPSATKSSPKSPLKDSPKSALRHYDLSEGIAYTNNTNSNTKNNKRPSSASAAATPTSHTHAHAHAHCNDPSTSSRSHSNSNSHSGFAKSTKSPPSMEKNRPTASSQPRSVPTRPSSAPRLRGGGRATDMGAGAGGAGGISCGTPRRKGEEFGFQSANRGGRSKHESPATGLSQPHAQEQEQDHARAHVLSQPMSQSQSHARSLSRSPHADAGPVGDGALGGSSSSSSSRDSRGGRGEGGGEDSLANSLNAPPIQAPFFMQSQQKQQQQPTTSPSTSSSYTLSSSTKQPKKNPASPFIHNKSINQPMIGDTNNFRHQLYNHSHMQNLKTKPSQHPPEVVYKSPPHEVKTSTSTKALSHAHAQAHALSQSHSKSTTEERFTSSNFISDDFSTEFQEDNESAAAGGGGMSPSAIAAAKASALRIDSAYAAAECMKASLRAEAGTGTGTDSPTADESKKAATTIAMLDVMMQSLEKSKLSLDDILLSPAGEEEDRDGDRDRGRDSQGGGERRKQKQSHRTNQHKQRSTSENDEHDDDEDDSASNSDDRSASYKYNARHQTQEREREQEREHDVKQSSGRARNSRSSRGSSSGGDKRWPSSQSGAKGGRSGSSPRTRYGSPVPSPSPDMDLLMTNELNSVSSSSGGEGGGGGGGGRGGRWDGHDDDNNFRYDNYDNYEDTMDHAPYRGKFASSSSSSHYDSTPNRVYTSSLLADSSGGGGAFGQTTASKSDFSELQRFGKSTGTGAGADGEHDDLNHSAGNNTSSAGNRNVAAAVMARYKHKKSGKPALGEVPRVWRICLSQGPLLKAFEENPIRFDVENSTIDVVWRDSRTVLNTTSKGEYSYTSTKSAKASTLRRERFHFNESYAGPGGLGKLCSYARQRVKRSVQTGRGIAFVCVAAGDGESQHRGTSQVEPPVSVVLGDCGGQGLISAVMGSLFHYLSPRGYPCKSSDQTMHRKYGGKNAPPVLASSASVTEAANEPVLFSAVVISEGSIVDLLGPSGSLVYHKGSNAPGQHQKRPCRVSRKASGAYYVAHMTRLQLNSVADFERVAGVLLGRRSALREMVPFLEEMLAAMPYSDVMEGEMQVPDTPWLLSSKQEATLLFTVSTKMHNSAMPSVHSQSTNDLNFFFTCPCGDNWSLPGNELCLLSEGVGALPHAPAPSLVQAGVLPQLLLDPNTSPLDYVNVATVIRQDNVSSSSSSSSSSREYASEKGQQSVQNSLHSFRVVTSDS